jgi:hypothetical protein
VAWLEASQTREEGMDEAIYKELMRNYRKRLDSLHARNDEETAGDHQAHVASRERRIDATRDAIQVERATAMRLRNDGKINDEVLRRIEYELDLSETRLAAVR